MKKVIFNSEEGRAIMDFYVMALNGGIEGIKDAYDKKQAEYASYDEELKKHIDWLFEVL